MASQKADIPTEAPTQFAVSIAAALAAATVLAPKAPLHIPFFPSHSTPPFFRNVKPRRGKWTPEEVNYAEFLIQEFEQGSLEGCENGCTLRAFLSRKLHCAPMRISKKFAGKSIGKLIFLSKTNGAVCTARLRELEDKFYKSLYEEMNESGHHLVGPYLVHSSYPIAPTMMPMMPQPMPVMPPASDLTNQLHQTYLNALNQMKTSPNVHNETTTAPRQATITTYHRAVTNGHHPGIHHPAAPRQGAHHVAAPSQVTVTPLPAPLHHGVHHPATTGQATAKHRASPPTLLDSHRSAAPFVGAPHPVPSAPNRVDKPAPDVNFLLGFERVQAQNHATPCAVAGASTSLMGDFNNLPLQYSPPLTSKSFDELHLLLGSGLPPKPSPFELDGSRKGDAVDHVGLNPSQPHTARGNNTNTAAGRQVSADLYATFAQQSAQAVNQHYAYCFMDENTEGKHGLGEQLPAPADVSSSLAAMHGDRKIQTVSHANLWAHAQQQQQDAIPLQPKPPHTFLARDNIVSGSERSSEFGSASIHGSYRSSSDNTWNDSDSISDEGPPRKKAKANVDREVLSPVSSDRSST